MRPSPFVSFLVCLSVLILCGTSLAQQAPDRITTAITAGETRQLAAGVPMQARPEFDQGRVEPAFRLTYITMLTAPSAAQQKALNKLLADQQNPASASYHHWLTPEQYADRFGLSRNDVTKIAAWLRAQGFSVVNVARARNWIAFSGTAAQVERVFQTEIHTFQTDGELRFSNTTPPTIPAALVGVVTGFRGLSNFPVKSKARRAQPDYDFPVTGGTLYYIAPGDIAAMYDLNALYTASTPIDGTGQTLAVIGQTDVYLDDLNDFRSGFDITQINNCTTNTNNVITSCSAGNFNYVYADAQAGTDPGVPNSACQQCDDLPEADIDLEWSNAVARNATIAYVNAPLTGVFTAAYYAIDNAVAPVMTMSYGGCELGEAEGGYLSSDEFEWQQANTEGITFMVSAGDTGAAECDYRENNAVYGYAVDYPASSPSITGVGGTLIPYSDYTSTYWNTSNDTNGDGGSLVGWVSNEEAWNDSQEFGEFCTANPTNSFCTGNKITTWASAQSLIGIWAGGGGVSNCVFINTSTGECTSGFPQPSWQSGISLTTIDPTSAGVTNTPTRFSPDVALLASIYWPGYLLCTAADEVGGTGTASSCSPGGSQGIINDQTTYGYAWGGTSIASPVFAGMVAMLNQYVVAKGIQNTPGLGNINQMLYSLAATASNGAFHHLNTGSNGAYCTENTPSGQPAALQCPSTGSNPGFLGFDASKADSATGYNLVTGLGSVDANKLFLAWAGASLASTATTISSSAPGGANYGTPITFTATVTTTGSTTPTGSVTFYDGASSLGTGTLNGLTPNQATVTTSSVVGPSDSITAVYNGDSANGTSTSPALTQTINEPTLTMAAVSGPSPTAAGEPASATVSVATNMPGTVSLSCNTPTGAVLGCSVSPTSISATSTPQNITLTITTTGPNTTGSQSGVRQRRADNRSPWLPLSLPLAGVLFAGFAGRKGSKQFAVAALCASLLLAGLLIACGGGSSAPVAITMSPGSASLYPNYTGWPSQSATFSATVSNTSNTSVNWSLSSTASCSAASSPCGTITGGAYTAPTIALGLPSNVTITATSQADSTKTATSAVSIKSATIPTAITGSAYTVTVFAVEGATTTSQAVSLTTN